MPAPWLLPHLAAPLAALVDHTLLKPEATAEEIARLCDEAVRLRFGAICVHGQWVGEAVARLRGSPVAVVAVVGFPLGANGLVAKAAETRLVVADGATEVDMVLPLGSVKGGRWEEVCDEVTAVVDAARGRPVKAIVESAALTPRELELACRAAVEAGALYVKTSTGFHPAGGATVEAVQLMRRVVGDRAGVKASGGVRTVDDALRMLRAGASRLGTSAAAGWPAVGAGRPLGDLLAADAGHAGASAAGG